MKTIMLNGGTYYYMTHKSRNSNYICYYTCVCIFKYPLVYLIFICKRRYDDYEATDNDRSCISPQNTNIEIVNEEEDNENIDHSNIAKLNGVKTPNGKKIVFISPANTGEKKYTQYNVHWRYVHYVNFVYGYNLS
jgi:hypothetical protein